MTPANFIKYTLPLWLLSFLYSTISAQSYQLYQAPDTITSLKKYTKLYVDKEKISTLETVLDLEEDAFISLEEFSIPPKFEGGKYRYWFRFSIQNSHPTDTIKTFLRIKPKDTLHLYQYEQGILTQTIKGHHNKDFNLEQKSQFLTKNHFFPLSIPSNTRYDYWVMAGARMSASDLLINLYPSTHVPHEVFKTRVPYYIWSGVFLGVLLFVSLYNSFQYVQNKDKAFLYYALYAFSSAFYFFRRLIVSDWFLKSTELDWFTAYEIQAPFSFAIYIFYILFVNTSVSFDFSELSKM